jgi:hypothetical protein
MRNKKASAAVFFCALGLWATPLLVGQSTGTFSGTVSDKAGAVISGATVKAISQGTGISREAKTDDSGRYLIPLLPVAYYAIRVESPGFAPSEQKDVRLQVDEHRELDFALVPASVTTAVEVSATEVAVQTTNATLGQVITSEQVAELPLNGRDFVQLATLTPGTTTETNPNSFFNAGASSEVAARGTFSLSVGGSRANSTDWLFDGNDNNELTAGGIAILPSIDAIQEFKVLTYNYSAEYGTRGGPTVLLTTKSGSNQFHGGLFEFFRNTDLDARSARSAFREQFNLNQFGFDLGGPIQKDKTFFFLDYQAKMQRHGIPFEGFVPTAAMRTGDFSSDLFGNALAAGDQILYNPYSTTATTRQPFMCDSSGNAIPANPDGTQTGGSPCNKIPSNLINRVAAAMVTLYPGTNSTSSAGNFSSVPVRKLNEGEFDIRLDHNFSSKDSVFARFSYDQAVSFVPGGSPGFAEANPFASTQNITNHGRNVAVSETHIFSDRNLNQFNAGFNRIFNHILSYGNGTCESSQLPASSIDPSPTLIPGSNLGSKCDSLTGYPASLSQSTKDCVSCGLASTQINGPYWSLGDRGYSPFQGGTNVFSVSDTFDMIRGNHNLRVGGGIRVNQMNVLANGFADGYWIFTNSWSSNLGAAGTGDNMADFLLGMVDLALHDQTFQGATTGRRWKLFRPFVQDDWRATPDLTVNLGLAWALVTPITEAENRQSNFDFATGQYLIPGQNSDGRVGIQLDKTALEPRIGLAWKPMGSQTTALRAGYAIFHDSSWSMGAQGLWQNPPYFQETAGGSFFFPDLCPAGWTNVPTPACASTLASSQPGPGMIISNGFQFSTTPPVPSAFGGNINSQNLNFKQGMVQQFNLNVEHQLPGNVVLTAGYAGSRSSHILSSFENLNVASPSACGTAGYSLGCGISSPPYPNLGTIYSIRDVGAARYDSLQVKAETKSTRHGIYALLGYTWARNFDNGLSDGLGSNTGATYWPLPGANKLDWGLSQIQLNDQFTASILYDLPFGKGKRFGSTWSGPGNTVFGGWTVNVIEKMTSGFPLFLVSSTNNSGVLFSDNGNNYNRPIEISNPHQAGPVPSNPNPACSTTVSQGGIAPDHLGPSTVMFNNCAFTDAPFGELGTLPRAPLYGPDFVNTDFSVIKHFRLPYREGMQLDFRGEFFNVFNHAQYFMGGLGFSGLQDVDTEANFGAANATVNNPRVIQFALKLEF